MTGTKSYSRNGSLEQAIILAIQYASPVALNARDGHNIDVKDIIGRDISLVDQAWERLQTFSRCRRNGLS